MAIVKIEDFKDLLRNGPVQFKFTKKDGTLREALGTLDPSYIPEDHQPKNETSFTSKNVRYYDMELKAWRSVSGDTTEVEVL